MPEPELVDMLDKCQAGADVSQNAEKIFQNIKTLTAPETRVSDLKLIVEKLFVLGVSVVTTREFLNSFNEALRGLVSSEPETVTEAGAYAHRFISEQSPVRNSLIEGLCTLKEIIAEAHESQEEFAEAAKVLLEIPTDTSQRRLDDVGKARLWVRIVRNYLEVDDSTSAESYLNKLKNIMHNVPDEELNLHFRLSVARVHDAKREFLHAAKAYHDISFSPAIAEEERLHTLAMAIKCAILAPAGPMRSRALARLYKDERSVQLEEFPILEKMFLDRIITPAEVDKFAKGLSPHQLATTADGSTVLAKAVVEHNLLSVSRLYSNVGFDELGLLLGLAPEKAEETTAKMIEQGRLSGSIDQIDRIIWFEGGDASGEKGSGRAEVPVGKEMRKWDSNVQALAEDLEKLTDALQAEFPEFVAARIAAY
ncbi:putative COP9 signalosome protein [Thermochaetoides thermophila DSM 1495]|uniref:COP9 signalosome complex subunit 4 n=1 Tax=Chaetomium thermophilum (strain DSM 1495 / CBS 144.50 / IMI 039719) TaxID=759272 RepID=G0RZP3_CHATD|nr:putative COP9 signalosome protein [Thermochaetoides thermophila DSM 1495]EGS23671.1 putative COP9 signalosome protein [Thermochaetoides thermophila DSM 1495]